jgi:hypothetical protein
MITSSRYIRQMSHCNPAKTVSISRSNVAGALEPSTSPWASGVVLVKKKDGSTRFCVDYRNLNKVTIKDAYPLPRIDDSLKQMSGATWLCVLDLCSGYWQVECHPKDRPKTAFATRRGLYQFQVMPFGLCNAPATFERLMETVLAGLQWDICLIYLDDVIIYGKNVDEMIRNLSLVFDRLSSAGLKLKPRKCRLFAREVEYLGHVVSENGISTDPKKIEAVKTWPEPTTVTELRSFIGFCSYYRRLIEGFASLRPADDSLSKTKDKFRIISSKFLSYMITSSRYLRQMSHCNPAKTVSISRFCVDYRNLNKVTIKDAYPLPRIDDSLNQMSGAKWFCVLDLCSGYWQVECHPKDRPKTAFATRRGLYQFQVMPFGLCNAPAP